MENKTHLKVSSSPHLHSKNSIAGAMRDVLIALVPASLASVYFFGLSALFIIMTSVTTAVLAEYGVQKLWGLKPSINDYSAAVTGLLLALILPPQTPLWVVFIGSATAVLIGKQIFGGLGNNLFNPAIVGRAVLVASWPVYLTAFRNPFDAVSSATPLGTLGQINGLGHLDSDLMASLPSLADMILGKIPGSMGETSALLILVGGLFLIIRKHIDWKIPTIYIATVFILSFIFSGPFPHLWFASYSIFAGGLFFGAFFMATDWVTSPTTKKGRILYAFLLGLLTFIIRKGAGLPEGVAYSIILVNILTPLIDRYTKGRVFGAVKKIG